MTFEEFFKKKKIDLGLLKTAEPQLFAEFELHYNQMGEKSFDHTKKYWFNTLRRNYHTPNEPKVDKVRIENPLAEQTITQSITPQAEAAAPKLGFKPKFKTAATAPDIPVENAAAVPEEKTEPVTNPGTPAPKLGFKPKFKPAAAPTPDEDVTAIPQQKPELAATPEASAPKLGFKPKFRSAAAPADSEPVLPHEKTEPEEPQTSAPKLGFKPKFKPAMASKPAESEPVPLARETEPVTNTDAATPKLGFKPKFRPAPAKPVEDTPAPPEEKTEQPE